MATMIPKQIKLKKVHPDAVLPYRAHDDDSGYDLFSVEDYYLNTNEIKIINTGWKIEIPKGYEAQIRSRSGLATVGISVVNSPGTIDAGFRGELAVILQNRSPNIVPLPKGSKIGQMVIQKIPAVELIEVEELSESSRGEKGFGSTGV